MPLETYSQDIVDTVREPLLMLDTTLRVHSANRAFYQTFQVTPEETEHHLIYELGNGQWDIPDLRRLLEDVVPKSLVFNDFELVHTFPVIGRRVMLLNARQLKAGNHGELLVLAMEDVTERRRAEEEVFQVAADLKAIETYSQDIVDTVREPLLMLDSTLRVHSANGAFYQTFQVSPAETEHHLIYELGNGQWDIPDLRRLLEDVVPKSSVFNDFELVHTFESIGRRVMLLNARKLKAGNHGELVLLAMEDVTERRRAEEEVAKTAADLKAIETYSQDIVDTVREPLLMLDSTLRVHSANGAFYQTFQVSPAETEHHLIYELGNGQWDIPDLRRLLEDVVPKSSVFNDFELVHTFESIGRRVMLLNARKLKAGNHGELVLLAMEDVTERRGAEEEVARAAADLKAIETYSQDIVDTVREPLLMLDSTLRVHSANGAFYQTFQVSPAETEHHLIYELGNGQWDIPDLRRLLEDVVPKSFVFNDFELVHTFPVIGRRVMLLNARTLKAGNHGELVLLAMEDVTERRRAEEEVARAAADLKAIEAFSQNIVDTVREPLLMLDTTLRVHSANRAFYQTFHVSMEETENRLIYELGNGQWDIPALRTLLEDVVPQSSVFNDFELEHTFPVIGRRVMLLNARQLKAGNHGELLVLAMEDVTERRRAEEEVANAKETAEEANRTKSLFLANMSHELRTPLNAILGYSEMLQEEAADQGIQEFLPDLEKIHVAGKHLLSLINDILDLSKIEAGKMELYLETFSIPKLISEVVQTIQPLVNNNSNRLTVMCSPELGTMRADMTKVRQSLFNLLSNAAKFTHAGAIELSVSREMMEDREWIWFRVSDTGIGMTPEQLVKLFQTFSQADASTTRKFGGSGLGLALTRRFSQMMGGDVTVNSVSGESSTFTIKVPAIVSELEHADVTLPGQAATKLTQSSHSESGEAGIKGKCVLVIDDDSVQRELMRRYLTAEGFTVDTARDGEEGLRLARQIKPLAITLDVMMPGMDGWTVLTHLKADPELHSIPVIMLTMMDDRKRGYALGADNYMTKPVDRKGLAELLKRYTCEGNACSVLLVEDDADTREMMRTMLERSGWVVSEAENGRVALSEIEKSIPTLILLDLMMPEMDGFEFAAEMHKHAEWRDIPIVVLSAKVLTADDIRRLNGSVQQIISKRGCTRGELMIQVCESLTERLGRGTNRPETVATHV
ncbi:MAG: response regulator [Fimbriimonas sp.]